MWHCLKLLCGQGDVLCQARCRLGLGLYPGSCPPRSDTDHFPPGFWVLDSAAGPGKEGAGMHSRGRRAKLLAGLCSACWSWGAEKSPLKPMGSQGRFPAGSWSMGKGLPSLCPGGFRAVVGEHRPGWGSPEPLDSKMRRHLKDRSLPELLSCLQNTIGFSLWSLCHFGVDLFNWPCSAPTCPGRLSRGWWCSVPSLPALSLLQCHQREKLLSRCLDVSHWGYVCALGGLGKVLAGGLWGNGASLPRCRAGQPSFQPA